MKWVGAGLIIAATGLASRPAAAQEMVPSVLGAGPTVPAAGQQGFAAFLIFAAVTTLVIVALGKLLDLRRRRDDEAVALEATISEALCASPEFVDSSVTARVTLPFWRGTPATIVMSGSVPSLPAARRALRLAARAAAEVRTDYFLDDRIRVDASASDRIHGAKGESGMLRRLAGVVKAVASVAVVLVGFTLLKYGFVIQHLNIR